MKGKSKVQSDSFVEFKSQLGNTIVILSQWKSEEDDGNVFRLTSPDGHATIHVHTFTVAGSGTLTQFQDVMLSDFEGNWQDSDWSEVEIGEAVARKRVLMPVDDKQGMSWLIYVLRSGECYHAIFVNANPVAMELNSGFYDEVVRSFKGISALP